VSLLMWLMRSGPSRELRPGERRAACRGPRALVSASTEEGPSFRSAPARAPLDGVP